MNFGLSGWTIHTKLSPCVGEVNGSHSKSSSRAMEVGTGLNLALKNRRPLRPVGRRGNIFLFRACSSQARSVWNFTAPRTRFKAVRRKRQTIVAIYEATVIVVHSVKKKMTWVLVEKMVDMLIPPFPSYQTLRVACERPSHRDSSIPCPLGTDMIAVFAMRRVVSIASVLFWGEVIALLHDVNLWDLTASNQPGCVGYAW